MKRIGIVGTDWRHAGTEGLADYTIGTDRRAAALPRIKERIGAVEIVYLATCNRVEIVLVGDGRTSMATYRQRVFRVLRGRDPKVREAEAELRAWVGEGAAEHLFRLACGLESAMLGEREIVGQMRDALRFSRDLGLGGPILEWLFDEAFKVGRRVHRATGLGDGKLSLAEVALAHVRDRLEEAPGRVALIGVSDMTLRCGRALVAQGVDVVLYNRTAARGRAAAAEMGATSRPLDRLPTDAPAELAALISATGAEEPVLDRAALERLGANASGHAPLLVDLATPPDIDPADARLADLPRIGLQEILAEAEIHRRGREEASATAQQLVDEALVDLESKLMSGVLDPLIAALQRRFRSTADRGVDRLLNKELPDLEPDAEEALRRWAAVLARRFAHLPSAGLRAVARSHGLGAVEAFLAAADESLAEELARLGDGKTRPVPESLEVVVDERAGRVLG